MSKEEATKVIGIHYSTIYRKIEQNIGKLGYSYTFAQQEECEHKEHLLGNWPISTEIKAKAGCIRKEEWETLRKIKFQIDLRGIF